MCAKRTIIDCDLCKAEVDDVDSLFKLSVKKPRAKGPGQSYEICPGCSEKLQQQLVSRQNLPKDWGFGYRPEDRTHPAGEWTPTADGVRPTESHSEPSGEEDENDAQLRRVRAREAARRRREEQESADLKDEDLGVAARVGAAPEREGDEDTTLSDRPSNIGKVSAARGDPDCSHYNKTRPQWGKIDEDGVVVEAMYQKCKECSATLRYRTKDQKARLTAGKTGGKDISLRTHRSENRKRY